jgi:heme a synthase
MGLPTATKSFNKLCLSTLVAVYVLILVGAIVRSSGSGMGCPDWPRCFGKWIPPSSVSELPSNYKETFTAIRLKKNQKFISLLRLIGLDETANKLESDKTVLVEEDFSPLKSKIEYINRVVGVVIGAMISLVMYRSFRFRKENMKFVLAAVGAWISVVFTGWFGSIVVSTNLTPWTVSVHLGFAFLIVGLLIYLVYATSDYQERAFDIPKWLVWGCFILSLVQMIFGVQVREALDQVAFSFSERRGEWVSMLGMEFIIHRSFSWVVFFANGWLSYKLFKIYGHSILSTGLVVLTLGSVLTGVGMAYFGVPPFFQPLHLLMSALIFGVLLMVGLGKYNLKG